MTAREALHRRHMLEAAIAWWKAKRPRGYSHTQHLDEPDSGLKDEAEVVLAKAIAAWLRAKRKEPVWKRDP